MLEQISPDSLSYTGSDKLHELGEVYIGPAGTKYVYGMFEYGAAVTCQEGDFVTPFSSSNSFGKATTWTADYSDGVLADLGYVAVAQGSHGATTSYGWFAVAGAVSIRQGTTEAIVDGDPLKLNGDKKPTKFATTTDNDYVRFGYALGNFSTVTATERKTVFLDGKGF